ncbi:MAG: hypothetical protein MK080_14150, partial [Opitutales bacterium]|nr:hypothetical protein [Opitutales bacterium]
PRQRPPISSRWPQCRLAPPSGHLIIRRKENTTCPKARTDLLLIIMEIAKSYITDEEGSVKSVVIDLDVFTRIEEALLDHGLAKAMEEVKEDPEISAEEMKRILSE